MSHLVNNDTVALACPTDTTVGGLVETFVANELAKQLTWNDVEAELCHYRDYRGAEIDLILEASEATAPYWKTCECLHISTPQLW